MEFLKKIIFAFLPDWLLKQLKKYHYYKKLKNSKESDEEDLQMLEKLIRPNSDVIDIGANFGLYTKFMSKLAGKDGKVLSFEPIHETYTYLKNNIEKLKLENVMAINIALSDKSGQVIMQVPNFNDKKRRNFYEAKIIDKPDDSLTQFEVATKTLDEVCTEHNIKPSFIKCDVEGHEWFVFKGAENVLRNYRPLLFVEINHVLTNPDDNTSKLLDYLNKAGYQLFVNSNHHLKKWASEKRFNYYFLTEEHIKNLSGIIEE